ncbi:MAG: response regulator [Deltaproteobacteria bacterium]|jgi:DNA-binding response OmpR family regulator|nr:response regulator [Deltaproteobacteria bacterium]MBT4525796.1 response regulator [Deltaproteobacteria bacterium]
MYKTILILEESTLVHDLFESALPKENWNWNVEHEQQPGRYIDRTKDVQPDIVFLSNNDHKDGYPTVNALQNDHNLNNVPIILLTSARDKIDEKQLQNIGVSGFLRKPFESSTLQDQLEAVFENQKQNRSKNRKQVLDSINVIDDELLDILADKNDETMSIDQLENELDITSQLLDDEVEDLPEEVTLADDTLYELDQTEIEAEETELVELESLEPVDDDLDDELEILELEDGDLDLESINSANDEMDIEESSEFMEIELLNDSMSLDKEIEEVETSVSQNTIPVMIEDIGSEEDPLLNRQTETSSVYNELIVEGEQFDSEQVASVSGTQNEYLELEVEKLSGFELTTQTQSDYIGEGGITNITIEFEDESELSDIVQENLEVEFDDFAESTDLDDENLGSDHINIDFEDDTDDLSDFDNISSGDEFEINDDSGSDIVENDVFDIEAENIAGDSSDENEQNGFDLDLLLNDDNQDNAASNIQQMINLRQVSKAKYDVLMDDDNTSDSEDIESEDNFFSGDDMFEETADEDIAEDINIESERMELSDDSQLSEETNSETGDSISLTDDISITNDSLFSEEVTIENDRNDPEVVLDLELAVDEEETGSFEDIDEGEIAVIEEPIADKLDDGSDDSLFEEPDESKDYSSDDLLMDVSLDLREEGDSRGSEIESDLDIVLPDISLEDSNEEDTNLELDIDGSTNLLDEIELEDFDQDMVLDADTSLLDEIEVNGDQAQTADSNLFEDPPDDISQEGALESETSSEDDLMSELSLDEEPELELLADSDLDEELPKQDLDTSYEEDLMSELSPEEGAQIESSTENDSYEDSLVELSLDEDQNTSTEEDLMSDLSLDEEPELELSTDINSFEEPLEEISLDGEMDLEAPPVEGEPNSELVLGDGSEMSEDLTAELKDLIDADIEPNPDEFDLLDESGKTDVENTQMLESNDEESNDSFQQDLEGEGLESEEIFDFEALESDTSENDTPEAELEPIEEPDQPEIIETDAHTKDNDQLQGQMKNIEAADDMTLEISNDVFEIGDLRLKSVAAEDEVPLKSPFGDQQDIISEVTSEENVTNDKFLENKLISDSNRKALKSLSKEHREELGSMLENVISDTLQSAINKVLPEMMEKIIQEELKD